MHNQLQELGTTPDGCSQEEIDADERQWEVQFAESGDFLAFLAQEALDDDAAGRTEPLDLDTR